jgi:hypothetical protein
VKKLLFGLLAAVLWCGAATGEDDLRLEQAHLILRPDPNGRWFVQNDDDHSPFRITATVEQTPRYLRIFFDRPYKKAGTVQITSDDGFANYVTGHASLGLTCISIEVYAGTLLIDPSDVWKYVPPDRVRSNGNFWVNAWMFRPRTESD